MFINNEYKYLIIITLCIMFKASKLLPMSNVFKFMYVE